MTVRWSTIWAVIIGTGLGALATFSLAAPSMSVYVITEVDEIGDQRTYEALKRAREGIVEAQFQDGRYLAQTEDVAPLDGVAPKAILIIAFDNEAKAKAYYTNTKELVAMRMASTKSRSFIVKICQNRGTVSSGC